MRTNPILALFMILIAALFFLPLAGTASPPGDQTAIALAPSTDLGTAPQAVAATESAFLDTVQINPAPIPATIALDPGNGPPMLAAFADLTRLASTESGDTRLASTDPGGGSPAPCPS